MLKEELTQEEHKILSKIFSNFECKLGLPEKFEDYRKMSDTDKFNTNYHTVGQMIISFQNKHNKLPDIRFDHIDFHRVYHDIEEEIKICEYLEEYGFYIRTDITDSDFKIEFKNKIHETVTSLDTNISFEKEKISLIHEDEEEYNENVEYTFLDLENIDNRKHKHVNIIENNEKLKDINKSQFKEIFEYINVFVYVEEDLEELEKLNQDKFEFRTIDQLKNIHIMDDLILNNVI
jgi:hypothetical protein